MEAKFIPGKIVQEFTTKSGKHAIIRYPQWSDGPAMTDWINNLSSENTYIRFSGERLSYEEEVHYLASLFVSIELGHSINLVCFVDNQFVGKCDINRQLQLRKRYQHVAKFGLSIAKDYRGEGVGYNLAQTTINEAKNNLTGLKLITLECFANNTVACNLYKKLGFQEAGKIPGMIKYNEDYVDEIVMSMSV